MQKTSSYKKIIAIATLVVMVATIIPANFSADGIMKANAQTSGNPQGSGSPYANLQGSQQVSPQANPQPQGPTGTPYGQYLAQQDRGFVGQGGQLNEQIQEYLQTHEGLGDIRANDASGIGQKYNPGGFGPFTDIANSPP